MVARLTMTLSSAIHQDHSPSSPILCRGLLEQDLWTCKLIRPRTSSSGLTLRCPRCLPTRRASPISTRLFKNRPLETSPSFSLYPRAAANQPSQPRLLQHCHPPRARAEAARVSTNPWRALRAVAVPSRPTCAAAVRCVPVQDASRSPTTSHRPRPRRRPWDPSHIPSARSRNLSCHLLPKEEDAVDPKSNNKATLIRLSIFRMLWA